MEKSSAMILTAACTAAMSVGLTFSAPTTSSYDDNPYRSRGTKAFKKNKYRKKTADKSRRINRRKR